MNSEILISLKELKNKKLFYRLENEIDKIQSNKELEDYIKNICKTNSKTTFQELLKQYEILIPMIQRDYAQGRNNLKATNIRNNFLDTIFYSESLHLDFIYGVVKDNCFIPIDGQQRLTTLYLLSWFFDKKNDLNNFSYETRISTKDFCKFLYSIKCNKKEKPSEQIKNNKDFLDIWLYDPSINSMINMLDAIYDKYKQNSKELNLNYISFNIFILNGLIDEEELYIKMNSRGKPLNEFENFKSKFEKFLLSKEENYYSNFIKKIDTTWADIFWNKYQEKYEEKMLIMFNFIGKHLLYKTKKDIKNIDKMNTFDIISNACQDLKNIEFIFSVFDNFDSILKKYDEIFILISDKDNKENKISINIDNKNYIDELLKGNTINLKIRFMLFLYIEFICSSVAYDKDFVYFLRVINNLFQSIATVNIGGVTIKTDLENTNKLINDIYSKRDEKYKNWIKNILYSDKIALIDNLVLEIERKKINKINSLDEVNRKYFYLLEQHPFFFADSSLLLKCDNFKQVYEVCKQIDKINIENNGNQSRTEENCNICNKRKVIQKLFYYGDFSIYGGNDKIYFGFGNQYNTNLCLNILFTQKYKNENFKSLQESIKSFFINFNQDVDFNNFQNKNLAIQYIVKFPELLDFNTYYSMFNNVNNFDRLLILEKTIYTSNTYLHPIINYICNIYEENISKIYPNLDNDNTSMVEFKSNNILKPGKYKLNKNAKEVINKFDTSKSLSEQIAQNLENILEKL